MSATKDLSVQPCMPESDTEPESDPEPEKNEDDHIAVGKSRPYICSIANAVVY